MKRILYFSGSHLTAFHWSNENCIAAYDFNSGEEGIEKFKTYLMATDNTPIRILVDLIEEDFNKEVIPHVVAADRRVIAERMIERQYRKSKDYVYYKIIDRETGGRRDDIMLYSIISNPEIIRPWLNIIRECNISISGIWSLPMMSKSLLTKLGIKAPNILLISQQVAGNLRQTFIKNNILQSSRSAVINLEEASIGRHISIEVEQTINFLSNQRYIEFNEKIEIHIMCREFDVEEIKNHCTDSVIRTFYYHKLNDITEQFGCHQKTTEQNALQISEYCNGLFSYVCASKLLPIGHYGNRSLFAKFYEQMISRTLYALSSVVLMFAVMMSLTYVSDANSFDNKLSALKEQAEVVNNQYKKNLANLENELSQAQLMKSSVLLAEKIQDYKSLSPQYFMSDISRTFSRAGMNNTEITRINWQQRQNNVLPAVNNNRNERQIDYSKPEAINQHVTIDGYIRTSSGSLSESVRTINSIANAFKNNPLIHKIKINKMPLDVRSNSSIENEGGIEKPNSGTQDKIRDRFEIEILMKGKKS